MSATYFETVQRQVRRQNRRIERSPARKASLRHLDGWVRDPAVTAVSQAATRPRTNGRLAPGVGLAFGALASLAMWLVIGKVVLSLIG